MVNPPNPQRPDLEDLVAFLEGRGSEAMRVLVLKRLDEDPDYLATMNDLVPMLREAGLIPEGGITPASPEPAESEPKTNVIGNPSRFQRRTGLIAIAAALVPIGVSMWLWTASNVRLPYQLMPPKFDSAQLQAWNSILDSEPWNSSDTLRGDNVATKPAVEPSNLLWVGAQIFDLEVAVRAQDRALAQKRLEVLQSTLGDKKKTTYGGLTWPADGERDWAGVEKEMATAYEWLAKPKGFSHDQLKQIERGTCLRAAFLAQQAGNPDFTKSWPDACRDALKDQDLNEEIERMRELFGPLSDDLETDEDGAAEAPPG